MKLRVLSYNMHRGFSGTSRKFVLSEIREAIRTVGADLVFLQEVLGDHSHFRKRIAEEIAGSQFEYLAESVWTHHAYGKNRIIGDGHQGNAVLSKFPILSMSNLDVSTNRFEKRGVLHVTVDWPGYSAPLHCICVHLNLTGRGRRQQLVKLCDKVLAEIPAEEPLIIAGDFNDWASSASKVLGARVGVHEVFKKNHGKHMGTFPARAPLLKLDRIYCRGFEGKNLAVYHKHNWKHLSDHAAISADLELSMS